MIEERVKRYLDKMGIRYAHVDRTLHLRTGCFSEIFKGRRKLTLEEYCALCSYLELPFDYFLKSEEK